MCSSGRGATHHANVGSKKDLPPEEKNTERDGGEKKTSLTRMFVQGGFVRVPPASRLTDSLKRLQC